MAPLLTEIKIKSLKPQEKIYRVFDAHGLYLEVSPAGGKSWRFKYKFNNKEKKLSLGRWPEVKLAEARELRDEARKALRSGNAPQKKNPIADISQTFRVVGEEWTDNMSRNEWSERHAEDVIGRMEKHAYPFLGNKDIAEITAPNILEIIRKLENKNFFEMARRILWNCSRIFDYAIATGRIVLNPCNGLINAMVPYKAKNYAAITKPKEAGLLMRAIDAYQGSPIVRFAMIFSALTFCRPGEIRHTEWQEISWEENMWYIPAEKMKMKEEHRVPLSCQAMEVLTQIRQLTSDGRYVFPSARTKARPMSESAVLAALRSMGYESSRMTPHGFRSMASTLLNEKGCRYDVIEAQLAHKDGNRVRAIYNRAEYMDERRKLMQDWADYLDELREGVYA